MALVEVDGKLYLVAEQGLRARSPERASGSSLNTHKYLRGSIWPTQYDGVDDLDCDGVKHWSPTDHGALLSVLAAETGTERALEASWETESGQAWGGCSEGYDEQYEPGQAGRVN